MNPNFLPTEFVLPLTWETSRQIIVDRESQTSDVVNSMQNGYFDSQEILTGQEFFPSAFGQARLTFRKVFNVGLLPNTGVLSVAHGITGITQLTHFYGAANTATSGLPIPFVGVSPIYLEMNATNIIITTTSDRSAYSCYVVVEYLKN